MARILIAGCGDVGTALGHVLAADGHEVTGLKRRPPAGAGPIRYIAADLTDAAALAGIDGGFDQIVVTVAPDAGREEAYRRVFRDGVMNLLERFSRADSPAAFTFVSSTGVYGQTGGEWVDESSPAEPTGFRGQTLLDAEQAMLSRDDNNTVIRFSGIYGPGRERLINLTRQGGEVQFEPPYYTNRIHRDDCVGVLKFVIDRKLAGEKLQPVYLGSDSEPAPSWEVIAWLADRLGVPPPAKKRQPGADQNKRCRNRRLVDAGYRFIYPSWRDGYDTMVSAADG